MGLMIVYSNCNYANLKITEMTPLEIKHMVCVYVRDPYVSACE